VPEPLIPDYRGRCLTGVVPGLLISPPGRRPEWFPEVLNHAQRTVLLVLDGLGWNQLQAHRANAPTIASMSGGPIASVAPTTTATALTSLCTGATPLEHGIVGYRIDMGGTIMNSLRWGDGRRDLRTIFRPADVQPIPPFCGLDIDVVARVEHRNTGFTEAHQRGAAYRGWRSPSSLAVEIGSALDAGARFVYAYYDGIDTTAHEHGFGSHYESEIRFVDGLVKSILDVLPSDVVLAIVADHGQVQTADALIDLDPEVTRLIDHQSGEGRFRWLHARPGQETSLHEACSRYSSVAWVRTREQIIAEGWMGRVIGHQTEVSVRRLGDVALVPHGVHSFEDPADSTPASLVCRHGSLTPDEVLVPFLARVP
jgi:Type I phosphodiesterase / nucleotide pyrophosphatase